MPEFPLTNAYWPAQTFTPLRESTIGSLLYDAAHRAPDKIALIDGDAAGGKRRRWTYLALLADAERAARALLRRFSPGERIAVWAGSSPEWVILEFAAALAGLTLVTVNPAYQGDELAHVLGHSEADGLFMADEYRGADLHAILAKVRGRLPRLREVISSGNRDDFMMRAVGNAPLPPAGPLVAAPRDQRGRGLAARPGPADRVGAPTRSHRRRPRQAAPSRWRRPPIPLTIVRRRSDGRCPTPRCASPTCAPARPPPAAPSARSAPGATW